MVKKVQPQSVKDFALELVRLVQSRTTMRPVTYSETWYEEGEWFTFEAFVLIGEGKQVQQLKQHSCVPLLLAASVDDSMLTHIRQELLKVIRSKKSAAFLKTLSAKSGPAKEKKARAPIRR
jgi:hypothetical protein